MYSPGLEGIIAGETAISTIDDGLSYRGYPVEELADRASFEEVAYLILHGDLPNVSELAGFKSRLAKVGSLPAPIVDTLQSLPPHCSMMDVMRSGTSLLGHWADLVDDHSHAANLTKAERLLAELPIVMATAYRLRRGLAPVASDPGLSFAANVLWMTTGKRPTERASRALDVTLIMYAEHEFNASTFTARVVSSTLADLHSAIVAAIGALKGPLHGGANERVMEVLSQVGSAQKAADWVRDAFARKVRIMGFGHRVYKTGDVRAKYLKPLCAELARESGLEDLESTAEIIEQYVLREKNIPPNLDWPSARIYHYLGLPVELYTPLFVVSRVTGWSAHVIEQHDNNRLIRPRSRYTGPDRRPWTDLPNRA